MAGKAVGLFFLLFALDSATAIGQEMHPDSVINQVFRALTGEQTDLPQNADELLVGPEWEALAYWDMNNPKQLDYMFEAVGDIYKFQEKSFSIQLVDPNNPRARLNAITGSYIRQNNELVLLSSSKKLNVLIIFVDTNYLVLEMDGLRLFFTKSRSYNAN